MDGIETTIAYYIIYILIYIHIIDFKRIVLFCRRLMNSIKYIFGWMAQQYKWLLVLFFAKNEWQRPTYITFTSCELGQLPLKLGHAPKIQWLWLHLDIFYLYFFISQEHKHAGSPDGKEMTIVYRYQICNVASLTLYRGGNATCIVHRLDSGPSSVISDWSQ